MVCSRCASASIITIYGLLAFISGTIWAQAYLMETEKSGGDRVKFSNSRMPDSPESNIYQLRAVLLGISPIIWRRLLVRSDSTIADLHCTLQTAFGWSDDQLHRFLIHGKQYGVAYLDGIAFRDDPRLIKLSDLGL